MKSFLQLKKETPMNNSILLIIDIMNDIVHPDGILTCFSNECDYVNYVNNINIAIDKLKQSNAIVVQSNVKFSKDYSELLSNSPLFGAVKPTKALIRNTWGTKSSDLLDTSKVDVAFEKNAIDPFSDRHFFDFIADNKIEHIYIAGVSTRWAVESCVRSAHDLNIKTSTISECCTDSNSLDHENALSNCRILGEVISINEL